MAVVDVVAVRYYLLMGLLRTVVSGRIGVVYNHHAQLSVYVGCPKQPAVTVRAITVAWRWRSNTAWLAWHLFAAQYVAVAC
jgi:hypothetical protein